MEKTDASISTPPWEGTGEVTFNTEGRAQMPNLDQQRIRQWVAAVAATYDRHVGAINYIFVDDERILEINRQFLQHDYYTDIITFDYTQGRIISGDLYISLDTVHTNAEQLAPQVPLKEGCTSREKLLPLMEEPERTELLRVIIHGVLHLCGINDKGPGEREVMEACEDKALALI